MLNQTRGCSSRPLRRGRQAASAQEVEGDALAVAAGHRLGVAQGEGGHVGVGAVEDGLDRDAAAGGDPAGEIDRDDQGDHGATRIDGPLDLAVSLGVSDQLEVARGAETARRSRGLRGWRSGPRR